MSAETRSRQPSTSPRPDAARIAGLRTGLDLMDEAALAAFGEHARLAVAASLDRLLADVRGPEVIQGAELLRRSVDLISKPDPARLVPTGWVRLFVGRRRRLARFRTDFQTAAAELETLAGSLSERADRLAGRDAALDRLHQTARAFILELDAHREAAAQTLAAAKPTDARDRLETRLESLDATRRRAVESLSWVRTIQNVDAPIGQAMTDAAQTLRRWRDDWMELLGLTPKRRGQRIRPDLVALYECKAEALEALARSVVVMATLRPRRHEAELKIEHAARSLALPHRR